MKKTLAILLGLLMTLTAGCERNAPPADGPGRPGTELVFWHSMSDIAGQQIDELVRTFNRTVGAERGISVTAVYQGQYSDATTKLRAVLGTEKTEELPDVMQMDATAKILYADSGRAYTFDDILRDHPEYEADLLYEGLCDNWSYRGVRLGVPFAASTTVLYYNKSLLDAAGADVPETLGEIARLAGKLPDGVDVFTCLPNSASLNNWIQQLGGKTFDRDNGTLGNAARLAAAEDGTLLTFLTAWKELYASGALRNSDSKTSDAFVGGKTALFVHSTSGLGGILRKVNGAFEVGVARFPRVSEDAGAGATSSGSALMAFDRGDESRKQASWVFMQYMTGPEAQASFSCATGYLPVNRLAAEEAEYRERIAETPQFETGVRQLADTDGGFTSVTVGPSADVYYAVQNNIGEMLENGLTPEETMRNMRDEIEGILDAYNRANG